MAGERKSIVVIIIIVLALLLWVVFYTKSPAQSPATQTQNELGTANSGNYARMGLLYQPYQFVINLLDGRRYLKTTISLVNLELQNEIVAKLPAIRDTIIDVLSLKSQFSNIRGTENPKEEIVQNLNEFLGKIRNVFFIDRVIQ